MTQIQKSNPAERGILRNPLVRQIRKFALDQKAVAAVEFAMIAPVYVTMLLGIAAFAQGQDSSTRVAQVSQTVADIISQSPSITPGQIDAALKAGEAIAGAEDAPEIAIMVAGIVIKSGGVTEVAWARGVNGATLPAKGSSYPLPSNLDSEPGFIIVSNAKYSFVPDFGTALIPEYQLNSDFYFVPRVSPETLCEACS